MIIVKKNKKQRRHFLHYSNYHNKKGNAVIGAFIREQFMYDLAKAWGIPL